MGIIVGDFFSYVDHQIVADYQTEIEAEEKRLGRMMTWHEKTFFAIRVHEQRVSTEVSNVKKIEDGLEFDVQQVGGKYTAPVTHVRIRSSKDDTSPPEEIK